LKATFSSQAFCAIKSSAAGPYRRMRFSFFWGAKRTEKTLPFLSKAGSMGTLIGMIVLI
jgi:hypothetical protein